MRKGLKNIGSIYSDQNNQLIAITMFRIVGNSIRKVFESVSVIYFNFCCVWSFSGF